MTLVSNNAHRAYAVIVKLKHTMNRRYSDNMKSVDCLEIKHQSSRVDTGHWRETSRIAVMVELYLDDGFGREKSDRSARRTKRKINPIKIRKLRS